ncbi:hypothetical protein QJS66_17750 [Kocuria rhizophila]|nr:hypothetical protein QJS66_17750 [Kocuria rhizophila]
MNDPTTTDHTAATALTPGSPAAPLHRLRRRGGARPGRRGPDGRSCAGR